MVQIAGSVVCCLGYVLSIMGRRRTLTHINSADWAARMQAERQAVNFVVQGRMCDECQCPSKLYGHWTFCSHHEQQKCFHTCVCAGSAADLCKMAMIRISDLVATSSSLSARYCHMNCKTNDATLLLCIHTLGVIAITYQLLSSPDKLELVFVSVSDHRLLAQLHDELLYEVEDSQVEEFSGGVEENS